MTKLDTLDTITSGYLSNAQIGSNFDKITTAFTNTLSRDGSTPNTMSVDFDLNSNRIINAADPSNNQDVVTKAYGDTNYGGTAAASASASAAASSASAAAALVSEGNASTSETNAATSATASASSAVSAQTSAAQADNKGVRRAEDVVVFLGDSLTSIPDYPTACAFIGDHTTATEVATGGHTLQQMIDRYAADVATLYDATTGATNRLFILGGTNDLTDAGSTTAVQAYVLLTTLCNLATTTGFNVTIVSPPLQDGTVDAVKIQDYINLIDAGWPDIAGEHIKLSADPRWQDTTDDYYYNGDAVHPNVSAGYPVTAATFDEKYVPRTASIAKYLPNNNENVRVTQLVHQDDTTSYIEAATIGASQGWAIYADARRYMSIGNGNIDVNPFGVTGASFRCWSDDASLLLDADSDNNVLILDGVNWPTADGSNGQTLITDGAGQASWADSAGGVAPVGSVIAPHTNLVVQYATASTVDIDADAIIATTTGDTPVKLNSVNLTVDITTSGANGLDTGAEASNTFYYLWVIYNGTTTAGLLSTSATAPTMPSGYTYKGLVGTVRNDGSSNFIDFYQRNKRVNATANNFLSSVDGVASLTSVSLASIIPSNASQLWVEVDIDGESTSGSPVVNMYSQNNQLGRVKMGADNSTSGDSSYHESILLDSTTIYYNANFTTTWNIDARVVGWEY